MRSPFPRCAGRIPESIGDLTNLRELRLWSNELEGQCANIVCLSQHTREKTREPTGERGTRNEEHGKIRKASPPPLLETVSETVPLCPSPPPPSSSPAVTEEELRKLLPGCENIKDARARPSIVSAPAILK